MWDMTTESTRIFIKAKVVYVWACVFWFSKRKKKEEVVLARVE